jgi:hypothetical protein
MTDEKTRPIKRSFGDRMLAAFLNLVQALVRLILIALLLAVVAFLVIGIPRLYQQFLAPRIKDIQRIEDAQTIQEQTNQQFTQSFKDLQQRIDSLAVRLDTEKQAGSELDALLEEITSTQQARVEVIQSTQANTDAAMGKIETQIGTLEGKINDLATSLQQFDTDLGALEDASQGLEQRMLSEDVPIAELKREIQLLKAMELLTRSRLFLVQNNLGLAEDDVQSARDILAELQVPDYQVEALKEMIDQLDLALDKLPDTPILAAQDLEIAWQLLKTGLPSEPTGGLGTGTPTVIVQDNLTLTPESTPSPTP